MALFIINFYNYNYDLHNLRNYSARFYERNSLRRLWLQNNLQKCFTKVRLKNIESEHSTFTLAVSEINKNLETLKYLSLTIIPVFTIGYDATLNTKL